MNAEKLLPRFVVIQVMVAVIAAGVTIATVINVNNLLEKKFQLEKEITQLIEKEREARSSLKSAIDELNRERSSPITELIEPRARAIKLKGYFDPQGRQLYDYSIWLAAPEKVKKEIEKVVYHLEHPSMLKKERESKEESMGFGINYRGWGCLSLVFARVYTKDGSCHSISFDMCSIAEYEE
ncbi:MAG: hypothetical protein GY847_40520 [Proteobacteria bacterium]|nr:hypothetical protein [Pseudomonadota bacterium]